MEELGIQTESKEPLLYLGLEGQWKEYHQSPQKPGASANYNGNYNQWPLRITEGEADGRELEPARRHSYLAELLLQAENKREKQPVLSFFPALSSSASDSHWPDLPESQSVREQENAILCNKEQSGAKGQRMDLRSNKPMAVQEISGMQPTIYVNTQWWTQSLKSFLST